MAEFREGPPPPPPFGRSPSPAPLRCAREDSARRRRAVSSPREALAERGRGTTRSVVEGVRLETDRGLGVTDNLVFSAPLPGAPPRAAPRADRSQAAPSGTASMERDTRPSPPGRRLSEQIKNDCNLVKKLSLFLPAGGSTPLPLQLRHEGLAPRASKATMCASNSKSL
jgi:hypothetical protein